MSDGEFGWQDAVRWTPNGVLPVEEEQPRLRLRPEVAAAFAAMALSLSVATARFGQKLEEFSRALNR